MRLTLTTPLETLVDANDVTHLRAEDDTGAFGVLTGHADFLTALAVSVVSWRTSSGRERHAAVHGGMLAVRDGTTISIATREAVTGDNLHALEADVLARFRRQLAEEQAARQDAQRLYLAAIRQICRFLRPPGSPGGEGTRGVVWPDGLEQ